MTGGEREGRGLADHHVSPPWALALFYEPVTAHDTVECRQLEHGRVKSEEGEFCSLIYDLCF